jgi:hypothetical protein
MGYILQRRQIPFCGYLLQLIVGCGIPSCLLPKSKHLEGD